MANGVAVWVGFALMVALAAAVLGTVDRRERYVFVAGVALVLVGMTALSGLAGGAVAAVGLAAVVASTVPMLVE